MSETVAAEILEVPSDVVAWERELEARELADFDSQLETEQSKPVHAARSSIDTDDSYIVEIISSENNPRDNWAAYVKPQLGTKPVRDVVNNWRDLAGKEPLLNAEQEVELAKRMEAGLYAGNLLLNKAHGRSRKKKEELECLQRDGREAYEQFFSANLLLAVSIASKYQYRAGTLSHEDLIQFANIGLDTAIKKFDHTRGIKFSTHATWWITREVRLGIKKQSRTIYVADVHHEQVSIDKSTAEYVKEYGVEPSYEELAEFMGKPTERIKQVRLWTREPDSLNRTYYSGQYQEMDIEFGDTLPDKSAEPEDDILNGLAAKRIVVAALKQLDDPREAQVMMLRNGLDGYIEHTVQETAKALGVSEKTVYEAQRSALIKIGAMQDIAEQTRQLLAESQRIV